MSVCEKAHSQLIRVLKGVCEPSRQLYGMQGLLLMRRGDSMSEWCGGVLAKVCLKVDLQWIYIPDKSQVDAQDRWSDFT